MSGPGTISPFIEERHAALFETVAQLARTEIATLPPAEDPESARAQAREILGIVGRAGLVRHALPEAFGGTADGPDLRACCLIREGLAAESPLADMVYGLQALGSTPIVMAGTDEQKRRFLPPVADGRAMAAFAMTEPEAGSDVAGIRTTARRDGDSYVLDGQKTLISNAGIADFYVVFASTDPAAGKKGLSAFAVDGAAPGLRLARALVPSAPHPLGEIAFEGCRVPLDARLGAEGEGMRIGLSTLDRLRATVAAAACGMAGRALREARAHALARRQFGKPLADFQLVRAKIARMATDLTAARLLTYRAALEADRGTHEVTLASAMAKAFASEAAQRIVDEAVQIAGGAGCLVGHPVERLYRAIRPLRIYEGTTEIQELVIASHLLKGD